MSRFLPLVKKIWVTDSCIFPFVLLSGTLIAQLSNNKRSSSESNNRFHSRIQLLYNKKIQCVGGKANQHSVRLCMPLFVGSQA